jgi:hypothetical protein
MLAQQKLDLLTNSLSLSLSPSCNVKRAKEEMRRSRKKISFLKFRVVDKTSRRRKKLVKFFTSSGKSDCLEDLFLLPSALLGNFDVAPLQVSLLLTLMFATQQKKHPSKKCGT